MKFIVNDMTCGHCRAAISEAVSEAGGTATIDLSRHELAIEGLDQAKAEEVIRSAGYSPVPA